MAIQQQNLNRAYVLPFEVRDNSRNGMHAVLDDSGEPTDTVEPSGKPKIWGVMDEGQVMIRL